MAPLKLKQFNKKSEEKNVIPTFKSCRNSLHWKPTSSVYISMIALKYNATGVKEHFKGPV